MGKGPRIILGCCLLLTVATASGLSTAAGESRIKDLATLEGLAQEPLLGYGLVVGLNGTGDGQSAEFTINALAAMLERLGVTVDPSQLKLKNVAAVLVTADLDPSAAVGSLADVTVSSLGDASSLEGGYLIMTPLKAASGQVCLLAQGSVSIGGFNIRSGANNSFRKNHPTVGMIPNGGKVTTKLGTPFIEGGRVAWLLHSPDFNTAARVAAAINSQFGEAVAKAQDAQRIQVKIPAAYTEQTVNFIAGMGELQAISDSPARVVFNERTGTIIVGQGVRLREAAVAHGNLKVVINTRYDVSQPSSFNESGQTVVTPAVTTDVQDQQASVIRVPATSTVADVVSVLNELGASPRDIIAILQALKQSGALQAELQIM
ncbi:MAG: flagellar basal body P-ring protein FlgI [bacterium]